MKSKPYYAMVAALVALFFAGCGDDFVSEESLYLEAKDAWVTHGMPRTKALSILSDCLVETNTLDEVEYVIYNTGNDFDSYVGFADERVTTWGPWDSANDEPGYFGPKGILPVSDFRIEIELGEAAPNYGAVLEPDS